jgi:hypothetical protein
MQGEKQETPSDRNVITPENIGTTGAKSRPKGDDKEGVSYMKNKKKKKPTLPFLNKL